MRAHDFVTTDKGSLAAMTGLMLGLLTVSVGGAVDLTQAANQRNNFQSLADISSLAAVRAAGATDAQRKMIITKYIESSKWCQKNRCDTIDISIKADVITVDIEASVPTSIMNVVGVKHLPISVSASAMAGPPGKLEVAMMLDYSGSMNTNNRYIAMGKAATSFVDQLEDESDGDGKIAMIPFSKYVLAPMEGRYVFDVAGGASLDGERIFGCLLNRQHPYSVSDETPNIATEGALWPVLSYVKSTTPTTMGMSDDYTGSASNWLPHEWSIHITSPSVGDFTATLDGRNDPSDGNSTSYSIKTNGYNATTGDLNYVIDVNHTVSITLRETGLSPAQINHFNNHVQVINALAPPQAPAVPLNNYAGSDGWSTPADANLPPDFNTALTVETLPPFCQRYVDNDLWLRPLSTDYKGLRDAFKSMQPSGLTNIALALDLGWHTLTPNAPYEEGEQEQKVERVAVLLTDGVQTVPAHGAGGNYNVDAANNNIAASCEAMKAQGITVFTVAFAVSNDTTRQLLRACSSGDDYFHEPADNGQLKGVFDAIFDQIATSGARLVK